MLHAGLVTPEQLQEEQEADVGLAVVWEVPRGRRTQLMRWAHDDPSRGHLGGKKTLARIRRYFTWPGIAGEIKRYCHSCGPCQRVGKGAAPEFAPLKLLPVVGRPFDLISADIIGPLPSTERGNKYLLTIIDHATRYLEAFALPRADAKAICRSLEEVFARHGLPGQFLTDRGTEFNNHLLKGFLKHYGVQPVLTPACRPQSNGTIERANATLKRMLKAGIEGVEERQWDEIIQWALFAYRTTPHESTGFSPFFLLYGREPSDALGLLQASWRGQDPNEQREIPVIQYLDQLQTQLHSAQREAYSTDYQSKEDNAALYDTRHRARERPFYSGDLVLVNLPSRGKKLQAGWQGPYTIVTKTGCQTYLADNAELSWDMMWRATLAEGDVWRATLAEAP
jgi:hypothetical protein